MSDTIELMRDAQEVAAVAQLPAIWVNRFRIFVQGGVTRIAFLDEGYNGVASTSPRSAIIMSTLDAKALAEVLLKTIEKSELQVAQLGGSQHEG